MNARAAGGRPATAAVEPGTRSGTRLVYLINLFPNLIETMIYREVGALIEMGHEVQTISIRRPDGHLVPAEAAHLAAQTLYILPVGWRQLLAAHVRALVRFRWRYVRTFVEVVTGTHASVRDRVRTACHFAEAVTVLSDVERYAPDHLHAHWAVGATTCAMVVSRLLGIPFSFTAHAYDIWRERLLLPEKLRAAEFVITCTDCNRRHLIDVYGARRSTTRVVYHGVDLDRFLPPPRAARGTTPRILSVGRLVEQKGFDRLLRACAAVEEPFVCEIVGEGPLRSDLERLARELGIADRVHFAGAMHQDALIERYRGADVFALLCGPASDDDRDGIPNTLIEAMAMELPCVSTRFSGVPELVADNTTGMLVEVDDIRGAAEALRRLLSSAPRRRTMGRAGRARVAEQFTIRASAAAMAAAFDGHHASVGHE